MRENNAFGANVGRSLRTRLRSQLGLIFWILLLPAALAVLGVWQSGRAIETLQAARQSSSQLSSTLAEVNEIATKNPMAILTFQGEEPKTLSALVAVSQLRAAISQNDEDLEISAIRRPFPWVTITGAIIAFVASLAGLLAAGIAGIRARKSQAQLIRSFERLRGFLPFVLAVLVIGFSVSAISAALFEAISLGLWTDFSAGSAKLFALLLVLAVIAAYSAFMALRGLRDVFALFTPEPLDLWARAVTTDEATGLSQMLHSLAERQQALLPDTIIVGLTNGFFVTESKIRLWPENKVLSGRTLYLPAPYLELLGGAEIAAIIGHELAHFSGEDTAYSQRFAPIHAGFWRALSALGRVDSGRFILYPASRLGLFAIERFDHAIGHWSRLREFDADRNGILLSSPDDAASALIRTGLIGAAVAHILERAYSDEYQGVDDDAAGDLVAETAELVRVAGWTDPRAQLEERQPHPTDSHPPTIQRIAALGAVLDDNLLRRATRAPAAAGASFAARLFADWAGLCANLSRDFIDNVKAMRGHRREALERIAAEAPGTIVIYDNAKPMIWTMAIIGGLFAVISAGSLVAVFYGGPRFDDLSRALIAPITGLGALACFGYAYFLHRGAKNPLMRLDPDGLTFFALDRPIGWAEVADYAVYASSRFALRLWLNEAAVLPRKNWRALYSKVDRRKRVVTLAAMGIRGMKADEFSGLVGRYRQAAYARQELGLQSLETA